MKDDLFLNIIYSSSSCLGRREAGDCITEYKGVVFADDNVNGINNEFAGEIHFKIINLNQAEAEGFDMYELFDTYEYTFRHSQDFYDFDKNSFRKPVINTFPDLEYGCSNVCLIETIGIMLKFRGKGIGAKVFKDLVWRFDHCELFILQPYPLQFEHPDNRSLSQKLNLKLFAKDKKKAVASLSNYYQSWGFKKIKGIKELLFYCSLYSNEPFDNIDMENY